jgi:hypothetical protein
LLVEVETGNWKIERFEDRSRKRIVAVYKEE